jgi:hypothetical protein
VSRGPGRWQRLLLRELYHNPKIGFDGRRYIKVSDHAVSASELSAAYRAARAILAKGWATGKIGGGRLVALPEPPDVVKRGDKCSQIRPIAGICEHLSLTSKFTNGLRIGW